METDANKAYEAFLSCFMAAYEKCFPLELWVKRKKIRKPWITHELHMRIKQKTGCLKNS